MMNPTINNTAKAFLPENKLLLSLFSIIMDLFPAIILLPSILYLLFQFCSLILQKRAQSCYLLHYECHKATDDRKLDTASCAKIVVRNKELGLEEYRFLLRTLVSSGLGEETYCPKNVVEGREDSPTLDDSLWEMDDIFYQTLDNLFAKTGVSPSDIDIVVTSVSLITAVPSLTSRVINRYNMRGDVKAYSLSGMGCSSTIVAVDLVKQLFKTHKNSMAIVVSTESIGPNWYGGKEKSMMLANILFRSGGCSMLFTNRCDLKDKAILKLSCSVRTHLGASDEAYNSCVQDEDVIGCRGIRLTRGLPKAANEALTANLRILLPQVLPMWEIVRYVIVSFYKTKIAKKSGTGSSGPGINLKTGIKHFCVHPGGRAVVDIIGKSLQLTSYDVEPTRMTLHRFGNTSSGGLWYVLGYMEAKKRLKKGDKILMISLGAGFKCNNCVWEVMKDLEDLNVWKDCVDLYPPNTTENPFAEKFDWINDPCLNFIKAEDYRTFQVN